MCYLKIYVEAPSACKTPQGCLTESGAEPGKLCVFPFNFKGTFYFECTTVENGDQPWCSVEVDSDGNHIGGKWGNCSSNC